MDSQDTGDSVKSERDMHIAALFGRYPDLSDAEIRDIKTWWAKEASSLDVAMMSCNQDIAPGYADFRKDHVDRLPMSGRHLTMVLVSLILISIVGYLLR
ncbi:hypothetical protein M3P36_10125 [Altererythrobacter sp. KTW20L]|uniref:hypothetical protein n=1 Tax=Altererythrobacter sp. KTW20L TaxID=2942210 RepID=UPI0020BE03E3|nr:hypothetical protein [Altererythrobacter sp. KTW20L]MCL6251394.1 hypothetical protein [Altererythrobacter sp. KTW20L]